MSRGRLPGLGNINKTDYYELLDPQPELTLTYLGTAGFILHDESRCVVLDPFLTRTPLMTTLFRRLIPHADLLRQHIPHADEVLVGHAHYDHVLDAPLLCQQTGARLVGSPAVMQVGRAAGLPDHQLCCTEGLEDIACGTWTVRGLPSRHGKAILGKIPFPGDITEPPPWPPRVHELRHGQVLNWWVDTGSLRVVHIDSADFIPEHLQGMQADVVCLCAVGRQYRPGYVREVVELLQPRYILPCHWDTMMTPLHDEPQVLPGVDLPGMLDEIRALGVQPLLTPILGQQRLKRAATA
ncbi:MAG: MBL fold metallo-hydrolase [Pseudomonadales bacterium]|nr:MBL fold metallo-hydrolase [Pseudomonadales bacterium]